MLEEYAGNWRIWRAFGAAVHHRNAAGDGIVANLHEKGTHATRTTSEDAPAADREQVEAVRTKIGKLA